MATHITEVTKKRINDFFKKYPSLRFDDLINKMLDNAIIILDKIDINTLNESLTSRIFDKIDSIENKIGLINETISQQIITNMLTFKNDFKNDIIMIMNSNTIENIIPQIEKYNEELYLKSLKLFNDIIPKNNEILTNTISTHLKELYESINSDTLRLTETTINTNTLNDFITIIDSKFNNSITNLQQNMNSNIHFTETRLNTQIGDVKELTIMNKEIQNQILTTTNKHFGKLENSSIKGSFSESTLNAVLVSIYENAEIIDVSKESHRGDFIMTRINKPKILFENKFRDDNVPTNEVTKFINDVLSENCSGIIMSQKTGISHKNNFEIDIDKNNNVLIYLTKVNYNPDIIKIAVNIIDYLKDILDKMFIDCPKDSKNIRDDDIQKINNEFFAFIEKKLEIIHNITSIKSTIDQIVKNFDNLTMPTFENLFIEKSKNISSSKKTYSCTICGDIFDTIKGRNIHNSICKKKQKQSQKSTEPTISIEDTIPENNIICIDNESKFEEQSIISSINSDDNSSTKKRKKYTIKMSETLIYCEYCNVFNSKNPRSVKSHCLNCPAKNK
jgi:hypothetical protein